MFGEPVTPCIYYLMNPSCWIELDVTVCNSEEVPINLWLKQPRWGGGHDPTRGLFLFIFAAASISQRVWYMQPNNIIVTPPCVTGISRNVRRFRVEIDTRSVALSVCATQQDMHRGTVLASRQTSQDRHTFPTQSATFKEASDPLVESRGRRCHIRVCPVGIPGLT